MSISKVKSKKYGYTYQVDVKYEDHMGIKQRHIKSGFLEERDAKKYQRDFLDRVEVKKLRIKEKSFTFNEVYNEFMELEGKNKYALATNTYYNFTHKNHIQNTIGQEKIYSIRYKDLQKFFNNYNTEDRKSTLRNMKKVFGATFRYAMRMGYVHENPVPLLQLPKESGEKIHVETISDEDLNRMIERIQIVGKTCPYPKSQNPEFTYKSYAMALIIGRYTGLRISEALALKKEDFDFENKTMNVCRKIEYIGLNRKSQHPTLRMKSKNSKSVVAISDTLIGYLKGWFAINPHELVLCTSDGNFISPPTLQKRIRDVRDELGIKFNYHMLRHTYATELMMSGANPVIVKELMRHSEVYTTWNTYTHPQREDQRQALDDLYMKME